VVRGERLAGSQRASELHRVHGLREPRHHLLPAIINRLIIRATQVPSSVQIPL
jgi:hypothetical protein